MRLKNRQEENGSNGQTRRNVLLGLGGTAVIGLAGCLGNDSSSSDPEPSDNNVGASSPTPPTQQNGDGTASLDLRMFPPNHNMDSFTSLSIAYESLVLTTTGGEDVTIPVDQSVSLKSDSTATGVSVAEDFAVTAREYAVIEVNYSIDQAITSDGQTAEIEFTSPASENVAELAGKPTIIEGSNPYVLQTHFGLLSAPWNLIMQRIVLGPGIPD
jgi:hypothetical protein